MADQHDIEALGDSLSASADALHAQLMRALRQRAPGGAAPAMTQGTAQALFENEVLLRQRANSLYLDSARLAAAGLGGAQQLLLAQTRRAQDAVARIDKVKDLVDLSAELLALGAAIAGGKPEHLVTPLEKLKHHLDALAPPARDGV